MRVRLRTTRTLVWKGLLGLALLPLFPSFCQRRPQAPAAPPPPNYQEIGDRYYDAGDYANAVAAYSTYLRENPNGAGREGVLFRLAMALALPSSTVQDHELAMAYLRELASRYPTSPLRPQAELVAHLEGEIQQLRAEMEQRAQQEDALSRELEALKQGEIERLRNDLKGREERIRQQLPACAKSWRRPLRSIGPTFHPSGTAAWQPPT